jgi:hypothetical protein
MINMKIVNPKSVTLKAVWSMELDADLKELHMITDGVTFGVWNSNVVTDSNKIWTISAALQCYGKDLYIKCFDDSHRHSLGTEQLGTIYAPNYDLLTYTLRFRLIKPTWTNATDFYDNWYWKLSGITSKLDRDTFQLALSDLKRLHVRSVLRNSK